MATEDKYTSSNKKPLTMQTHGEDGGSTHEQSESITLDPTPTVTSTRPAEPTLQGIPAELRNKIFEYSYPIEKRVIIGWKFLKAHANSQGGNGTLRQQFESAAISNPLSMTCRQMHHDYGAIDTSTSVPAYELVVSNFDLDQIDLFLRAIQESGISKEQVSFRPQIDNNIAYSACIFRDTVKKGSSWFDNQELRQRYDRFFRDFRSFYVPFSVRVKYRSSLGDVDWIKTATQEQLQEADEVFEGFVRDHYHVRETMLFQWVLRFLKMSNPSRPQSRLMY